MVKPNRSLNETAIESLENLQELYLQNNQIKALPKNVFISMKITLKKLNWGNICLKDSGFDSIEKFKFLYFSFNLLDKKPNVNIIKYLIKPIQYKNGKSKK